MNIKVLGSGCTRCKSLEKITKLAVQELGMKATVEKEEDIQIIMRYGILHTPALVIRGKVVLSGQVPKLSELKSLLTKNQ